MDHAAVLCGEPVRGENVIRAQVDAVDQGWERTATPATNTHATPAHREATGANEKDCQQLGVRSRSSLRPSVFATTDERDDGKEDEEDHAGAGHHQPNREQGWPIVQFDDMVPSRNAGLEHHSRERLER